MNPLSTVSILPMNPLGIGKPKAAAAPAPAPKSVGYFWKGADGNVYVQGDQGINSAGKWDANSAAYWGGKGFVQTADSAGTPSRTASATNLAAGSTTPAKVLDTAQLSSLDSLIGSLGSIKDQAVQKAAIKRDTSLKEKQDEKKLQETTYNGKKVQTLQDFNDAKVGTDLNTTSTLENLVSSLSTLGLGGSRALTRQILDAANMANRKANATQATNNQSLDTAFNDYTAGNENDIKKINDQYGYDEGEANRSYLQNKQNALYKKADVYNAVDDTGNRANVMNEANGLNDMIANAAFMNPQYTGEKKAMATPDLAGYNQDIAHYDTALDLGAGMQPVSGGVAPDGTGGAGNLAVKAVALTDNKDLGVKKKSEALLGYGV